MTLIQRLNSIHTLKFSFGKSNEHSETFANDIGACSMYLNGYGLSIPANLSSENQLRGVFREVMVQNGLFIFNLSGVDVQ